ncbi:TIGR02391 family protein [Metabacillus fastidiosus]|uniref:TIGR02391 family protein n=1 Tax=Metabacillus fastidiosus TaxID=1458 RepID=UPI000824862F|nr:TIGR02391 family protein [Metabacillus fastidiosus]MED4461823.1 TIGR02391 family protein [Metabacillus fastidiosus]
MKKIDNACIEKTTEILGDLVTGSQITNILAKYNWKDHDTESGIRLISTKRKRLEASMIYEIKKQQSAQPLFQLIEEIMTPVNFHNLDDIWNKNLKSINFILGFYGYELTDSGKITSVKATTTFTEAVQRSQRLMEKLTAHGIHDHVIKYCSPELLNENYFHAIFEASKSVLERLRILTNSSLDGNSLINDAFNIKNPSIVIDENFLKTNDERSQYMGLKSLLSSICYIYRNPTAHSPKLFNDKSENDAITAFILISLAHRQLDKCSCVRYLP